MALDRAKQPEYTRARMDDKKPQPFAYLGETPLMITSGMLYRQFPASLDYFVQDASGLRALSPAEIAERQRRDDLGMPNIAGEAYAINSAVVWRHADTEWRLRPNRDWCGLTLTRWESIRQSISKFFHWLFQL